MTRLVHDATDLDLPGATADGDALWLDRGDVERATGWAWKPQGLCRDDTCMPLPRGAAASTAGPGIVDGERIDIAAMWRHAGWPVVHDAASQIWVLGTGAGERADALRSLQAPDFELPDLDGRMHRLSDYRGRRVFLVAWASW